MEGSLATRDTARYARRMTNSNEVSKWNCATIERRTAQVDVDTEELLRLLLLCQKQS